MNESLPSPAGALFRRARFLTGARRPSQFPDDRGAEVAFAGRSNAGKSSALNALTGTRALARTSKTPGRTQEINFFILDQHRRLVDLPGYGYAKAPEAVRRQWALTLQHYLTRRRCLRGVVLVMDVRHPFTEFDRQFIAWCEGSSLPMHILFTKADKLSKNRAAATLRAARQRLSQTVSPPSAQLFSATSRQGTDELESRLLEWFGRPAAGCSDSPGSRQKKAPV